MAIRMIALDQDKTTLDKDGTLSWGNRQALIDMIERGIHIVVASGRPFSCMPRDVLDIPGLSYVISSNGAAVYDLKTGSQLHGFFVPAPAVRQMLAILHEERLLEEDRVIIEMVLHGQAYSDKRYVEDPLRFGASPQALPYIQSTREGLADTEAFLLDHIEELEAIDLVIKEAGLKQHLLKRMRKEIPDLYLTYSVPELIEISHKDAGKHNGVRFLMDYLGLDASEVAAFGDADNDVDMLSFVGTAVAMGNAEESCLAVADYVTRPNWEDGVAYGIYHGLKLGRKKEKPLKVVMFVSSLTGNTRKVAAGIEEYFYASGDRIRVYDSSLLAGRLKDISLRADQGEELLKAEAQGGKSLKKGDDWETEEADYYIIAFWCRKGFLDDDSILLGQALSGKKVLLIGTLGYYADSPYADRLKDKACKWISQTNDCLGVYLCQGRIQEERTEYRRSLPKSSHHYLDDQGYQRHLESRKHPDKEDIYGAIRLVMDKLR